MRTVTLVLTLLITFSHAYTRVIEKHSKHTRFERRLQNQSQNSTNSTNVTANVSAAASVAGSAASNETAALYGDPTDAPGVGTCNQNYLKAFGLAGLAAPTQTQLDVCPNVVNSCCTSGDQQVIIKNWVAGNEGANLDAKIANYTATLTAFFQAAARVSRQANRIIKIAGSGIPNECSLMARRILTYQIEDSAFELNAMLLRTYSFLSTSHKGLYCAMCNAKNTEFFRATEGKTIVSERFCRDYLISSLPTAVYLNSHFPRYANLMNMFVSSCDHRGIFKKNPPPQNATVPLDASLEGSLKRCFRNRNFDSWGTACVPVCEAFQIGQVTPMLVPKVAVYASATAFLNSRLDAIKTQRRASRAAVSGGNSTANATSNVTAYGSPVKKRILKEKGVKRRKLQGQATNGTSANSTAGNSSANASAAVGAPVSNPMTPLIYNSLGSTPSLTILSWTSGVRVRGINFFEAGILSDFSASTAKSLRALLKVRKLKTRAKRVRKLKSVSIQTTLISLLLIALFGHW